MPKWLKTAIAILLLPLVRAVLALARVLQLGRCGGVLGRARRSLLAGVFLPLPRPMLLYVFGHELTHALWTLLFGGRVKKFKVTAKGGHVLITKSNFLIVLAPYFFPLYVVLVVLIFAGGQVLFGWRSHHLPWFHLCVGAAYSFHVTLTWHILQTRQTDITSQGYLFSAVIIFLGNIGVLLVGLPLLTARVTVLTSLGWWLHESGGVLQRLSH
jgi:hypothetical protein